ncbi:unnamed protein product [Leuciscus chuanchicus]
MRMKIKGRMRRSTCPFLPLQEPMRSDASQSGMVLHRCMGSGREDVYPDSMCQKYRIAWVYTG